MVFTLFCGPHCSHTYLQEKKENVQLSKSNKAKEKEKNELQKLQALFNKVELKKNVPNCYKLLYKHATTFMKASGASIQIPCDVEIFGNEKTIFILHENLTSLLEFQMIGQAIITAYMA